MSHEQSESIKELATALSKAQGEITGAIKGSENPFFKSKYADLATCMEAIREPLANHGLSIIQTFGHDGGAVIVYTTLAHSSGEWIRGALAMTPDKRGPQGPQAVGSCISYARRYSLAIVGLVQLDDDAESAANPEPDKTSATRRTAASKADAKPAYDFPQIHDSPEIQRTAELTDTLDLCSSMDELQRVWKTMSVKEHNLIGAVCIKKLKEQLELPSEISAK